MKNILLKVINHCQNKETVVAEKLVDYKELGLVLGTSVFLKNIAYNYIISECSFTNSKSFMTIETTDDLLNVDEVKKIMADNFYKIIKVQSNNNLCKRIRGTVSRMLVKT